MPKKNWTVQMKRNMNISQPLGKMFNLTQKKKKREMQINTFF